MAWRIGVDIGGTFTDVALVDDASGRIGVAKVLTTPRDLAEGVLSALQTAMQGHAIAPADVGLLAHATTVVTNAILEEKGRTCRPGDHARLRRRAGAAALGARQSLRPVPGCAGHPHPAPAPLRDYRADRRGRRDRYTAGRDRNRGPDRRPQVRKRAGRGRLPAVQLPQRVPREAARRTPAGRAAGHQRLSVIRSSAGDPRVRAHQHDGGMRLRRADPRLIPGAAGGRHARPGPAAPVRDGIERRHPGSR